VQAGAGSSAAAAASPCRWRPGGPSPWPHYQGVVLHLWWVNYLHVCSCVRVCMSYGRGEASGAWSGAEVEQRQPRVKGAAATHTSHMAGWGVARSQWQVLCAWHSPWAPQLCVCVSLLLGGPVARVSGLHWLGTSRLINQSTVSTCSRVCGGLGIPPEGGGLGSHPQLWWKIDCAGQQWQAGLPAAWCMHWCSLCTSVPACRERPGAFMAGARCSMLCLAI
jgi:hypothetical protein